MATRSPKAWCYHVFMIVVENILGDGLTLRAGSAVESVTAEQQICEIRKKGSGVYLSYSRGILKAEVCNFCAASVTKINCKNNGCFVNTTLSAIS